MPRHLIVWLGKRSFRKNDVLHLCTDNFSHCKESNIVLLFINHIERFIKNPETNVKYQIDRLQFSDRGFQDRTAMTQSQLDRRVYWYKLQTWKLSVNREPSLYTLKTTLPLDIYFSRTKLPESSPLMKFASASLALISDLTVANLNEK